MASSNIVKVTFLADAKQFHDAIGGIGKSSQSLGDRLGSVGKKFTLGVTAPIVAGATLAIKAAADEQQQMETLATVIRNNLPDATQSHIDANEEWVTSMQNSIGVVDGDIRDMEQKFVAAGASIGEAQRLVAQAYDTAAATGKDAASVGDAMVKGLNGQTAGFSRLGVQVRNADGSMKSFDEILQDLTKHQGTAAAAADNAAGRAEIQRLKFADLQEDIGMMLIPILEKLTEILSKVTDWWAGLSDGQQQVVVSLFAVAAAVGPVLIVAGKLITAFGAIGKAFTVLSKLLLANPWMLLIAAVIALVVIIVTNWDTIVEYLKRVWDWLRTSATAVWDWLRDKVSAVARFIADLFLNWTLVGRIIKHWDDIKAAATAVWDWVTGRFEALIGFFVGVPERIRSALSGVREAITGVFKSAFNAVSGFWNRTLGNVSFSIPSWIPGVGGKGWSFPQMPTLHSGGVFRSPAGVGEGLALLRDGEHVLTPEQARMGPSGASGGDLYLTVNALDARGAAEAVVAALQEWQRRNGDLPLTVRGVA